MKTEATIAAKVIRAMAGTLMLQLLISRPLWIASLRTFPTVPLITWLPVQWGNTLDVIFYTVLFMACITLLVKPFSKLAVGALASVFFLFVLEDITRLQPWFYLYLLMLSGVIIYDKSKPGNILFIFKIVLSSCYLFSGAQKLNVHFAKEFFPWLSEFTGLRPLMESHHSIAYISAALEAVAGICLWIPRLRKTACFIILGTHLYILLSLGPFGHNWNMVVWPWNALFAWMTYAIFFRKAPKKHKSPKFSRLAGVHLAGIFLIAVILPIFGLIGKWDHFLSDGFYSGMVDEGTFYFPPSEKDRLPASSRTHQYLFVPEHKGLLFITQWALEEMQVPLYPEERVYREVAKKLSRKIGDTDSTGLKMLYSARFKIAKIPKEYSYKVLAVGGL